MNNNQIEVESQALASTGASQGSRRIAPEEVQAKVLSAVATALDVDVSEVPLNASLEEELGAESLDYLDISFAVERAFGIRFPRMNVMQAAEAHFGEGSLIQDGILTDLGLRMLRTMRPEIDPEEFRPGLRASEVGRYMTAQTFVRITLRLLEAKSEQRHSLDRCTKCGSKAITESKLAPEFQCESCHEVFAVESGDDILLRDLIAADLMATN